MKIVIFALLVLVALCVAKMPEKPEPLPVEEVETMYQKFLNKHDKVYSSNERQLRFGIFRENVEKARYYNILARSANYGVTKFSDLTEEEFRRTHLMKPFNPTGYPTDAEVLESYSPKNGFVRPDSVDWRDKGAVTEVKNQGGCGSCWAFSATGNIEGQNFLKNKKLVTLSEQELVDCDHSCSTYEKEKSCDAGCNGGLMWNAFDYVKSAGGLDSEKAYPYEGSDDKCRHNNATVAAKVSGYKFLPTKDEDLAAWVADNGPVAVAINANWLQFYFGGVSDPMWCDPTALDHGVLIVGYGKTKSWLGQDLNYWIMKNSWGSSWGESGFWRQAWGTCGVNRYPSTAVVV